MSIILNWRDYSPEDKERIISNLFSYISPRWYPNNIIGSSIFDIFEMYAEQLASASVEINQTKRDLSLEEVRISTIEDQTTSKIYDNFGTYFNVEKEFFRNYNEYNTTYSLPSYRKQLKFLNAGYSAGTTEEGISKILQAYTGVGPLLIEHTKFDEETWRLGATSGSVVRRGDDFIIIDSYVSEYDGYKVPITPNLFDDDDTFATGTIACFSRSKLGFNTKLSSMKEFYQETGIIVSVNPTVYADESFQSSLLSSIKKVIKSDQIPKIIHNDKFVTYVVPSSASISSDVVGVSDYKGLWTLKNTPYEGFSFAGNVLTLPLDYQSYDWYYDWGVVQKNDAEYCMAVRDYPYYIIPSTVYYKIFSQFPCPLFPPLGEYENCITHYLFADTDTLWDTSGNMFNLRRVVTGSIPCLISARDPQRVILSSSGSITLFSGSVSLISQMDNSFYCSMWLWGLDSHSSGSSPSYIVYKNQATQDIGWDLNSDGIRVGIDISNKMAHLDVKNSSISGISGSISPLFDELPIRPHYLSFTYSAPPSGSGVNSVIYMDDTTLTSGSIPLSLPSSSIESAVLRIQGDGYAVDEMFVSKGFLDYNTSTSHFYTTKPRVTSLKVPSGSVLQYHQPQIMIFASGSGDFEFHSFSMIGNTYKNINPYIPKMRVPEYYSPPITAYGALISTYCDGYDLMGVYLDGVGGVYEDLIEHNSLSCGYTEDFKCFNLVLGNIDNAWNVVEGGWSTNKPSTSELHWGTTLLLDRVSSASVSSSGLAHFITLASGVVDSTLYYGRAKAVDVEGNVAWSDIETFFLSDQIYRTYDLSNIYASNVVSVLDVNHEITTEVSGLTWESGSISSYISDLTVLNPSLTTSSVSEIIQASGSYSIPYSGSVA
jgi:hypothetical protein